MPTSSRRSRLGLRFVALGYLALLLAIPVAMVFYRTFENGIGPAFDAVTALPAQHAFWLTILAVAIAVPANTIFGIGLALALVRGRWKGKTLVSGARRPAVRGLAGRRRPRADPRLWQQGLARNVAGGERHPDHLDAGNRARHDLRLVAVRGARGRAGAARDRHRAGGRGELRVIAGLERPDAGEVLFSGESVTGLPAQQRGVGFVFQHYAAFKHMTVRDNIAFGLTIRKRPKGEVRARVDELLALVHLEGFARRYPAQLSGGQRQRMALARALAVQPRVLLLDEPFGALDVTVRKELRDWLRRLHDEVQVTTIFVTHDQEEALEVAEQVAVINGGQIEQTGTPDDLYERPANPFVMGFVGPVSRLGDTWVRPHDIEILEDREDGAIEALVERVAKVGFEVVETVLGDGTPVPILATRLEVDQLELRAGQIVWLRVHHALRFAA